MDWPDRLTGDWSSNLQGRLEMLSGRHQTKKVNIAQRVLPVTYLAGRKNSKEPVPIEELHAYEVRSWEKYGLQDICGTTQLMRRAYITPAAMLLIYKFSGMSKDVIYVFIQWPFSQYTK